MSGSDNSLKIAILVAALGYFVDVFDLVLFSIVRVPSLKSLGLSAEAITDNGVLLLNAQMTGMLLGGLLWGLMGDKFGRVKVLFGSILLYSLANLANAYVQDVTSYAVLRFVAGFGLAGEVGAGITLVAELMPKEKRGLATAFVAAVGVGGALVASLVVKLFDWQTAYIVGGVGGLFILLLRVGVHESGMFGALPEAGRADLRLLFTRERLVRYLACLMIGVPIWFYVGIILTFCPEIGKAMGLAEALEPSKAVFYGYIGFVTGDMGSGIVSQLLRSRRKAILIFILGGMATVSAILKLSPAHSAMTFYLLCTVGGFFMGYWALMLTSAAEQFGTNIRATVTTTAPNFVRGFTVVVTSLFSLLKAPMGVVGAVEAVAALVFALALLALWGLRETFHLDLDFVERRA